MPSRKDVNKMSDNENNQSRGRVPGLYATYATGFFSLSLAPMTSLVVPLWALSIGATPGMIGIIVACRAVLPFFLSIHGGAMMDRLGTRRMLLIFTAVGTLLSFLYPVSSWMGALVVLQLIVGWAQGMGWIGAQIKIARISAGDAASAGRFSFFTTCGTFLGPLIAGATWDIFGPWGAFSLIGLWGICLLLACYALPVTAEREPPPLRWRELLPDPADYWRAFALMSIPAVAFIVGATFLRISALSVQGSFYTVYLQGIGLSGSLIGILIGFESLIGGPASLLTGVTVKAIRPHWLLLLSIGIAIVAISITPLLDSFIPLLIAAGIFGVGVGMGFPLLLSILSEAASSREQGLSVGLRTTANRLASIVVPVVMGFVIEFTGIELGFYVIGVTLFVILCIVAWAVHRSGAFARN
jgi:MFS family permease